MREVSQQNNQYILRFEAGEELNATLLRWVKEHDFQAGYVSAIGACEQAVLGYFDVEENAYVWNEYDAQMELVSLTGNLAVKDGEPMLHMHAVLSGRDFQPVAGHLKAFHVRPTCEVYFQAFENPIERTKDDATGLFLIDGKTV